MAEPQKILNTPDGKSSRRRFSLGYCLLASVLLHLLILLYRFAPSLLKPHNPEANEPIEISEVPKELLTPQSPAKKPPPPDKNLQIVETEDANNRKVNPNAKYLGEHNQSVEKQQRAKLVDDFRKKHGTGSSSTKPESHESIPPTGEGQSAESEVAKGEGEKAAKALKKGGVKRDWKTLSLKDLSVGGDGGTLAATDDKLDNVDAADRTILSTREFKFYGYYFRIKQLLRQYWKPNIEHEIARIWGKGERITDDELTTKVLVLLDKEGSVKKISKLGSSGFQEIDEAAVDAFERASPFPHPPQGLVDPDGFVRIRWDFILTTDSGPVIQFRSIGSVPP